MTEMYDKIDNHAEIAKGRLTQRWKEKEYIDKMVEEEANRLQLLEDVLYEMLTKRSISTGAGVALDGIGELFGEQGKRNGKGDPEYKSYLLVLPAKLREAGQHEVLITAYKNLANAEKIRTVYHYPRAIELFATVSDIGAVQNLDSINKEMQSIVAYGVRLNLSIEEPDGMFEFATTDDGGVSDGAGFATTDDGSDGGQFAKSING